MAEKAITGTRGVTECFGFSNDKVQKVRAILCLAQPVPKFVKNLEPGPTLPFAGSTQHY